MTDSIADTSEDLNEVEADLEGLQSLPGGNPNGQDVGENGADLVDFLKSKSPEKKLEQYQGHTLDFDGSESTRRLIRGLEGLLGATNYALADLVIGVAQKISGLQGSGKNESDEWRDVP